MRLKVLLVILAVLGVLSVASMAFAHPPGWNESDWRKFMDAIRTIETGDKANGGLGAVGDHYAAIGPYQIHKDCYKDACEYDPTLVKDHKYEDCLKDKEYSERVLQAYINRYLPKGGTFEDAARIWNGGPKGYKKKSTLGYLAKFKKIFG